MNTQINDDIPSKNTKLDRTSKAKDVSNNKNSTSSDYKWIKNIRALPSNQKTNDVLKKEYIEVNLNNSRKLIRNINNLSHTSEKFTSAIEEANDNLIRLKSIKKEFEWLNDIRDP